MCTQEVKQLPLPLYQEVRDHLHKENNMPGVVRVGADQHQGHSDKPFHKTSYATGSSNVFTNNDQTVKVGDTCACGDPAVQGSPNVFVNNQPIHRQGDATGGHGTWVPNAAETGSSNVFANS